MNGQDPSSQHTHVAANARTLSETLAVNAPIENKPAAAQQLTDVGERMSGFERLTLLLAGIGLIVTILTGAFIALQWYEMHSGAADTHTLAEAAKAQAEAAKTQSENTARELPIFQEQVTAAQDSVKAIQTQMRQDQRAWLNIDFGPISWVENQPIKVQMVLTNKGKTPAKHILGGAFVEKILINQKPHFGEHVQEFGTGFLAPNLPVGNWGFQSAHEHVPLPMLKADVEELNGARAIAVVHGKITYSDIFGIEHWLKFCSYNAAPAFIATKAVQDTAEPCTKYNDADNN